MPNTNATDSARPHPLGLIALLLGATAIGLAPIFVRWSETGSTATAFWRVALAVPFLAAWRRWELPQQPQPTDRRLLLPGLWFAADLAVWHLSILWTSVANATLLGNGAPLFVALVAWLWWGDRWRWPFTAGLVVALAGAAVLLPVSFAVSPRHLRGDVLGIVTALFYAGYQLTVKQLRYRHTTGTVMFWTSAVAATVLLAVALALGEPLFPASARGWWVVVGLALVSQVAGQGLITWGVAHLPVSFGSVSLLWQPVVAAGAGLLLLGESLRAVQLAGGLLVLAGIYLARRGSVNGDR